MALPNESGKDFSQKKDSSLLNFREKSNIFKLMGSFSSSSSNEEVPDTDQNQMKISMTSTSDGEMVKLNVYGLTEVNNVINYFGLGIYHSGVELYGNEWAYGGYPKPIASIYRMRKPRDLTSLSDIDGRFHYVQTFEMGKTHFTLQEVKKILDNLGKTDWIGTNYHLLYRNCNSFSNEFCKILCGNTIPSWINRVATIFSKFPYLVNMLPEEFFMPVALQEKLKEEQVQKYQLLKAHLKMENEKSTESLEIKDLKSNISKSELTIKSTTSTIEKSEIPLKTPQVLKNSVKSFGSVIEKGEHLNLSEVLKQKFSPSPANRKVKSEKMDEKSNKNNKLK